jgi:hypothetical protein
MGRTLFMQENFEKLESVFQTFRSERTRTASGLWKLTVLYAGLEDSLSGFEGRSKSVSSINFTIKSFRDDRPS